LRLTPAEPLDCRVAVFTAAPARTDHLDAVFVSHDLARRDVLREQLASLDVDTYLIELKAAAIDVVAEHALAHGKRIVLARNELVSPALDDRVLALLERVHA
jgi:cyclic 2,3-diphosphoglycerate synthase